MSDSLLRLRIATYNVHKCRGLDRRVDPERIAEVIRALDADVIGLQEVLDVRTGEARWDQARRIAALLDGYAWCFGENRRLRGGAYGNMTLSRFPITFSENYDLSHRQRERRGCLRADLRLGESLCLHALNVHLGTGFLERRHQGRRFLELLEGVDLRDPRVVLGDFNEWTRGRTTREMRASFQTADFEEKSYPGLMPVLHLDHFYFDEHLQLEEVRLFRSRLALIASDHLPLVADFALRR